MKLRWPRACLPGWSPGPRQHLQAQAGGHSYGLGTLGIPQLGLQKVSHPILSCAQESGQQARESSCPWRSPSPHGGTRLPEPGIRICLLEDSGVLPRGWCGPPCHAPSSPNSTMDSIPRGRSDHPHQFPGGSSTEHPSFSSPLIQQTFPDPPGGPPRATLWGH